MNWIVSSLPISLSLDFVIPSKLRIRLEGVHRGFSSAVLLKRKFIW